MANSPSTDTATKQPTAALSRSNFRLRESANNCFRAIAARGVTRERLLDSDYWATVAEMLVPYDKLYVVAEDRSYFAELLVLEAGRGYASVVELAYHPLPALLVTGDGLPPNHRIEHQGPDSLYAVIRTSDGVVLGKGFPSKQDALAFLLDHATLK